MEACRRSRDQNGQPKSFPGTLSVYQFIPLCAQSWGMLIMRRAGGAIEITLQRWGLYYVQRASQFNACCSELWLITPGCCSTPEVHLWNVLKHTTHSPVQYTDLCCWEMNTEPPFFSHRELKILPLCCTFRITCRCPFTGTQYILEKAIMDYVIFTQWGWWWRSSLMWHIPRLHPERCLGNGCLPLHSWTQLKSYSVLQEQRDISVTRTHTDKDK